MIKKMIEFENKLKALTEEFETFKKSKKTPEIGDTVEIADMKWIILDKLSEGYLALAAEPVGNKQFGDCNDWRNSTIRKFLDEMAKDIEDKIGSTLPEFERDLLSLDGQTEYGTCRDKVSLIAVDEYRKYRKHIPNAGYWWWTITPDSTKCNDDETWIRVVSPSGGIDGDDCSIDCGVRPFCITQTVRVGSKPKSAKIQKDAQPSQKGKHKGMYYDRQRDYLQVSKSVSGLSESQSGKGL